MGCLIVVAIFRNTEKEVNIEPQVNNSNSKSYLNNENWIIVKSSVLILTDTRTLHKQFAASIDYQKICVRRHDKWNWNWELQIAPSIYKA